jgi:hypothetical protein
MTAEESISKGRWPDLSASVYLFYLDSDQSSSIDTLKWTHDWTVPESEMFVKDTFGVYVDGGQQELIYVVLNALDRRLQNSCYHDEGNTRV